MNGRLVIVDPEGHLDSLAELKSGGIDRPSAVGTRSLFELDGDDEPGSVRDRRGSRGRRRPIGDVLRSGRECKDLTVHLGMARPAEFRAVNRECPWTIDAHPEDIRHPWNRIDLDPKVGHVEGMDDVSRRDLEEEGLPDLEVQRPGGAEARDRSVPFRVLEQPDPLGSNHLDLVIVRRGSLDRTERGNCENRDGREDYNGADRPGDFEASVVCSWPTVGRTPPWRVTIPFHRQK